MIRLIAGGLIGAGLVYFLGPNGAARRRGLTQSKATSLTGGGLGKVVDTAQTAVKKAQGVVRETVPMQHDNPNPDDLTLRDRIESELFRDPKLGRDKMNINVVRGVVELRGELPTQADIDAVISSVNSIRDVLGVESYLHTPGTPAPNKEAAIEAS